MFSKEGFHDSERIYIEQVCPRTKSNTPIVAKQHDMLGLGHNKNVSLQNVLMIPLFLSPQVNDAQMWKVDRQNSKCHE